jgi:heme a synthase
VSKIFSESFFRKIGLLTVASILFLIFIGGVVRMTGSGMGCPDWPKCFGYLIPPTNLSELTWSPNREFKRGQMIIKDKKLWVAQENFTTKQNFDTAKWTVYTKHNYALFNPVHTYIEWINRMVSVLVGIFMVLTLVSSFQYRKTRKSIVLLSIAAFLFTLFQAWLGAKVVESNLSGNKISIHMLASLVTVGLMMASVFKNHAAEGLDRIKHMRWLNIGIYGVILLTLVQIYYGTHVREAVDEWLPKARGTGHSWTDFVGSILASHKSLSVFVMAAIMVLYFMVANKLEKTNLLVKAITWSLGFAAAQIVLGTLNVFLDLPPVVRVLHVTLAGLLVASQFYIAILLYNYKKVATE